MTPGERQRVGDERRAWNGVIAEIGSAYAGATLENFQLHGSSQDRDLQGRSLNRVREYCQTMPTCLNLAHPALFFGSCGTGKDHLMVGMIRHAIASGVYSIKWVDAVEMFGEFKDAISQNIPLGEVFKLYTEPQLLVISDSLPVNEPLREFEQEILFRIVNGRRRRLKANWMNLNVATRDEAVSKLGEKILSRFEQDALVLKMQWPDYRRFAN